MILRIPTIVNRSLSPSSTFDLRVPADILVNMDGVSVASHGSVARRGAHRSKISYGAADIGVENLADASFFKHDKFPSNVEMFERWEGTPSPSYLWHDIVESKAQESSPESEISLGSVTTSTDTETSETGGNTEMSFHRFNRFSRERVGSGSSIDMFAAFSETEQFEGGSADDEPNDLFPVGWTVLVRLDGIIDPARIIDRVVRGTSVRYWCRLANIRRELWFEYR